MKQTTNYHLNQWDPGDRLLRTDFNGDNGKIDAAIHEMDGRVTTLAEKSGLKLLKTITTTQQAQAVSFPISGFDWNQYRKIHVEIIPYNVDGSGSHVEFFLNDNPTYLLGKTFGCSPDYLSTFWVTFFPMYSAARGASILGIGTYQSYFLDLRLRCLNVFSIMPRCFSGDFIKVGSIARIYGEA